METDEFLKKMDDMAATNRYIGAARILGYLLDHHAIDVEMAISIKNQLKELID